MDIQKEVLQTIKKINLSKKEKILVSISGGKDSAVLIYLLKYFGYNISGFHINLGLGEYSTKCQNAVEKLCNQLDIRLYIYNLEKEEKYTIKSLWEKIENLNHCAVCGIIKKSIINKQARKLGFDKIATGHNLDDEVQTFILNILKGSPELSANTGVITKNIKDEKFVPRIKPLFYTQEKDILKFAKAKKIFFIPGKCEFATTSYRIEIRDFLAKFPLKLKKNIISNLEKISFKFQKEKRINYCKICGEPSRNDVCRVCKLLRN